MKTQQQWIQDRRTGFTLVELAVIVVILGVLSAFGVPRFLHSMECSKASEAFGYLSAVRSAQERFQAQEGTYADDLAALNLQVPPPKYFHVGNFDLGCSDRPQDCWSMTLTRAGTSPGYGGYTVIFTEAGYDATNSTIPIDINPIAGSIPSQGDQGG